MNRQYENAQKGCLRALRGATLDDVETVPSAAYGVGSCAADDKWDGEIPFYEWLEQQQEEMPEDFQKTVDEHFWELL